MNKKSILFFTLLNIVLMTGVVGGVLFYFVYTRPMRMAYPILSSLRSEGARIVRAALSGRSRVQLKKVERWCRHSVCVARHKVTQTMRGTRRLPLSPAHYRCHADRMSAPLFNTHPLPMNTKAIHLFCLLTVFGLLAYAQGDRKPGDGYPGHFEAYAPSPDLTFHMTTYNLTARWFERAPVGLEFFKNWNLSIPNRLPYLLYTPENKGNAPVPLVLYFMGTGAVGEDLTKFKQALIFKLVSDPAFQKKHPCYLFVPMLPGVGEFRSGVSGAPTPLATLVCDAMLAVIRDAKSPPVDMNRIYVTGHSFGGGAAIEMMTQWPGRFAACVPVENIPSLPMIPKEKPGNYWFIYNDKGGVKEERESHLETVRRLIVSRGGDCRVGRYPAAGHEAWGRAWREDQLWQWVFSKTADGRASQVIGKPTAKQIVDIEKPVCFASVPGQVGYEPERAADGLDTTWYMSSAPVILGGYWQIEYPTPRAGRVKVYTGRRDGKGIVTSGRVEVSADGKYWTRAGGFSTNKDGSCSFQQNTPFKFLRVLPTSTPPEVLIVRRVEIK